MQLSVELHDYITFELLPLKYAKVYFSFTRVHLKIKQFCHLLLAFMSFQTCVTFIILWNIFCKILGKEH